MVSENSSKQNDYNSILFFKMANYVLFKNHKKAALNQKRREFVGKEIYFLLAGKLNMKLKNQDRLTEINLIR